MSLFTFPILIQAAALVRKGNTCGIRRFIIDHSERKQSEEEKRKLKVQFQQAQRLETIGTLAGGIAHDFNNLLMTIQGNTSLMLFDIDISHPHYDSLKNIEKQIERGAKLTKQLTDAGVNLRGFSGAAIGRRAVLHLAFDSAADTNKAARLIKKRTS